MTINDFFGVIFFLVVLNSAIASVFSKNSVYSVFFLVTSVISSASLLFLYKCEFIPLLFVIVYVGAVAVLFLFVIMMLNVKIKDLQNLRIKYTPTGFYICIFFLLSSLTNNFEYWFKMKNPYYNSIKYNEYSGWLNKIDIIIEMDAIGRVLYSYYVMPFLISGFLLFLAVLGSVSLVIDSKNEQNLFKFSKQL
jgi:NADH-quinone oxidoreductase subunit J